MKNEDDNSNLFRLLLLLMWMLFGHKVEFSQTLSTRFGQEFKVEVQARF